MPGRSHVMNKIAAVDCAVSEWVAVAVSRLVSYWDTPECCLSPIPTAHVFPPFADGNSNPYFHYRQLDVSHIALWFPFLVLCAWVPAPYLSSSTSVSIWPCRLVNLSIFVGRPTPMQPTVPTCSSVWCYRVLGSQSVPLTRTQRKGV